MQIIKVIKMVKMIKTMTLNNMGKICTEKLVLIVEKNKFWKK